MPNSPDEKDIAAIHIGPNLKLLRNRLSFTQKEFIQRYFKGEDGKARITISKLSLIERGDLGHIHEIASLFSKNYGISSEMLYLPLEQFSQAISPTLHQSQAYNTSNAAAHPIPPKRSSYVEDLVKFLSDYLMDEMMCGMLHPGDKIDSEREMMRKFQVSRSALREALKVLSSIGLLDIRPGQGTFIATQNSDFFNSTLSWPLVLGEQTSEDILELRLILECESAHHSAQRYSKTDAHDLACIIDKMKESMDRKDPEQFLNLDIEFHLAIAKATQNRVIYHLFSTIRKIMRHYSQTGMVRDSDIEDIFREHSEIYEAIINGNADFAKTSMKHHIQRSNARYNQSIQMRKNIQETK